MTDSELTMRLRTLRDRMSEGLIEREIVIRQALLAMLAGEHILLIGPPGTAKSLAARRLHRALRDGGYFERLLSRFTLPEELFGPLSIKALEDNRYERLTDRYMPTASVAFLDEIFKANSAILNALLTLLNEREFDNGTERTRTPLVAVVGASNELPKEEELLALYDRFLIRMHVGPVSRDGFRDLIRLRGDAQPHIPPEQALSRAELDQIRQEAQHVEVPPDIEALLDQASQWAEASQLEVSDRRWRKIVSLLQMSAYTNGRETVNLWDCWLLQFCLCDDPEDSDKVFDWYRKYVEGAKDSGGRSFERLIVSLEELLQKDRDPVVPAFDEKNRPLFDIPKKGGNSDREPLFRLTDNFRKERRGYYQAEKLRDSELDNAKEGYRESDIMKFYVEEEGRQTGFAEWKLRSKYLRDRGNCLDSSSKYQRSLDPRQFSRAHVDDRTKNAKEPIEMVLAQIQFAQDQKDSLHNDIQHHLWIDPEFADVAATGISRRMEEYESYKNRLELVLEGFKNLPQEDANDLGTMEVAGERESAD